MAPSKSPKTGVKEKKEKKEKVFHPDSRKAGQLARTQLRKGKLAGQASKRSKKHSSQVDVYGFFYHALPEGGVLTLEDIHTLVRDVWLKRHDAELDAERTSRRKGRPKSVKEQKLQEIQLQETDQYRTGMEVLDLTHEANVALFRQWDQIEAPFVRMLRFIRITSTNPDVAILTRPGTHLTLLDRDAPPSSEECAMDVVDAPLLSELPSRFGSMIMIMDEPM
ncbi:hypothetical protein OF83DRAFT_1048457 [Amylostereum chailletii]|nr:hypothetical protein OF83DRAFT_1048457 [Amylostereum chailletii]